MKFVVRQPREGINVSETHPLLEAGTLIAGLAAIFSIVAVALVFLVELSLYFISPEDEVRLFDGWLPDDLLVIGHSDERVDAVQRLVDRLSRHWPESPYAYRVEIDDSEVSNAMALPGGLIIVTRGLLDQVDSENELAFVLGHELGHFKNRDHLRALGRGVVLSVVFSAVTGNDVAGIGIQAADITLRGFSRRQETGADNFGLTIVNAEYGHVHESWRLFKRWDIDDNALIDLVAYVSTHPDSGDRVEHMKQFAMRKGWLLQGEVTPLNWPSDSAKRMHRE